MTTDQAKPDEFAGATRYRSLTGVWRWIPRIIAVVVVFLGVNWTFDLRLFVNYMLFGPTYYYILVALLLSLCFLSIPVKPGLKGVRARRLFWVDIACFLLVLGIGGYLAWHGLDMIRQGWARVAPLSAVIMAAILWFLLIEAARRTTGYVLGALVLIASFYPIFAQYLPGILQGLSRSFLRTAQFHMLGTDSVIGMLMTVFAELVVPFTVFGVAAVCTGAGKFFLDTALSIFGHMRGGPAKVAVVASAMFGMVSGSSVINVITTGSTTIPAMKKSGFEPHVAGAVETCASSAGTFTPPIMGSTAFVMASFLNMSYPEVAIAAAVPAALFYIALYTQIDGYAVKKGMRGLSKEERPSFTKALKNGWFFVPVIAVLLYVLFVMRLVAEAAYISTAVMLVLAQVRKETRFTRKSFLAFLDQTVGALMELLVMLAAVGMLMGSLIITGLATVFARELLNLAGGNTFLITIMAVVAGFVMGMGMPLIATYVLLSIVIAPALIMVGFDPLASHLFILYVGVLSFITPPVALCAFAAAPIAQAPAMKIGLTAVRLGGAIFLLPFFFLYEPALILHGNLGEILLTVSTSTVGIFIIASALGGYMVGIGKLWPTKEGDYSFWSYLLRLPLLAAGLLIAIPGFVSDFIGLGLAAVMLPSAYIVARRQRLVTGQESNNKQVNDSNS